jgi:hypothetical protein
MKKQIVALVLRSLLTLLLTGGVAIAEDTPQLQKLKHTVLSPSSEQVVLQLNGSYSPNVFTLKDENPRVIFDFAGMRYGREVKGITSTNGAIVKRIRVGMHTDGSPKTRIVFDVATLKGVTYTQKFDEKSSALVIQFTGTEKAAAQRKPKPKTGEAPQAQPATAENAPQTPTEATAAGTSAPMQLSGQPKSAAEQTDAAQLDKTQSHPAPVETAATPKSEPVKPADETVSAPSPKPVEVPVEKKAVEKPLAAPPVLAKPEASAEAKPEKSAKETAAAPVTEEKKEEKKAETATKEPPRPETASEPQEPAPSQTGDKGKSDSAKTAAPAKTQEGPQLEYVKFDATSPKGEMVMFKLNGFHPPSVHGVEEGIPRVICDFNNTKLVDTTKNLIKTNGKLVKVIRTSKTKKPERVRVVIDLEPNRNYDLQQVFFKEDNLFVIIVNAVKK